MQLPRPVRLAAGSVYAAAATLFVTLAVVTLAAGPVPRAVAAVAGGLVCLVAVDGGRREFRAALLGETGEAVHLERSDAADAPAVALAGPLTYVLSVSLALGPVVASALVGLVAALTVGNRAPAAYCGSFVGMVSAAVLPTLWPVAAASLLAAVVYVLAKRVFDGFGGKLGTTAFVGCTAVVVPLPYTYLPADRLAVTPAAAAVLAATVGAVAAFLLSVRYDHGPVVGSAVVGLVAGLLAPPAFGAVGDTLAAAAFAGSFVGMVSTDRLGTLGLVGVAGLLSGVVFVGLVPAFGGSGGKLGTIAFAACLVTWTAETALGAPVPSDS